MPNRMLRTWVKATDLAISLAGSTTTVVDLLSDYRTEKGVGELRGTIGAFYGETVIKPQAILSTSSMGHFAMAIGVLDMRTSAATAPNPLEDSFPWMWRWDSFIHPQAQESSAGNFTFVEVRRIIEIRSQRIMRINESLFYIARTSMGAAMNHTIGGQILLKQ